MLVVTDYNSDTWTPTSTIYISPDGGSWTKGISFAGNLSVTAGEGSFLAVGSAYDVNTGMQSNTVFASPDGISWTQSSLNVSGLIGDVLYANKSFVVVSTDYTSDTWSPTSSIYTSSDGLAWTKGLSFAGDLSVWTREGKFLAVGSAYDVNTGTQSNTVFVSVDGLSWTQSSLAVSDYVSNILSGNGTLVIITTGYNPDTWTPINTIYTSKDGETWTESSTIEGYISFYGYPVPMLSSGVAGGVACPLISSPALNTPTTGSPGIAVSVSSLNFGKVNQGSPSEIKTIMVRNAGTSDLVISSVDVRGKNAKDFSLLNNCSTVQAGKACYILLNLTAAAYGNRNATLDISSNDPKKAVTVVNLSGEAVPPKISVSPTSLQFGAVQTGNESPPQTVLIKNTGQSDLLINSVDMTGSGFSQFSQTNNCTTVPTGTSCTVSVIFTPNTKGARTAGLKIVSNDPKKPAITVKLQGKGL